MHFPVPEQLTWLWNGWGAEHKSHVFVVRPVESSCHRQHLATVWSWAKFWQLLLLQSHQVVGLAVSWAPELDSSRSLMLAPMPMSSAMVEMLSLLFGHYALCCSSSLYMLCYFSSSYQPAHSLSLSLFRS